MNRSTFLCSLAGAAAAAVFPSCSSAPVDPAWPGRRFASVRAFAYSCEAGSTDFLQPGGALHPAIINGEGAPLTAEQAQRLQAILTTPAKRKGHTACYVPHHSFVFFDAAGRAVASADVCFTCRRHRAFPDGLPGVIDYDALWTLIHELGVPADVTPHFYENLWKQQQRSRR